jgi:hypothetical protein
MHCSTCRPVQDWFSPKSPMPRQSGQSDYVRTQIPLLDDGKNFALTWKITSKKGEQLWYFPPIRNGGVMSHNRHFTFKATFSIAAALALLQAGPGQASADSGSRPQPSGPSAASPSSSNVPKSAAVVRPSSQRPATNSYVPPVSVMVMNPKPFYGPNPPSYVVTGNTPIKLPAVKPPVTQFSKPPTTSYPKPVANAPVCTTKVVAGKSTLSCK